MESKFLGLVWWYWLIIALAIFLFIWLWNNVLKPVVTPNRTIKKPTDPNSPTYNEDKTAYDSYVNGTANQWRKFLDETTLNPFNNWGDDLANNLMNQRDVTIQDVGAAYNANPVKGGTSFYVDISNHKSGWEVTFFGESVKDKLLKKLSSLSIN